MSDDEPKILRDRPPKMYSREELDAIVRGKLAEQRRKLEKRFAAERQQTIADAVTEVLRQLGANLKESETNDGR